MTIDELWRPILGYEGLYEISSYGRIKSLNYRKTHNAKILKSFLKPNGYEVINIRGKNYYIHRLVAQSFLPTNKDNVEVDHINNIKSDNRIENLRWATHKENCCNPLTKKVHSQKAKNRPAIDEETRKRMRESSLKRTDNGRTAPRKVLCIDTGTIYESLHDAAKETNSVLGNISKVCHGQRKTSNGLKWCFI